MLIMKYPQNYIYYLIVLLLLTACSAGKSLKRAEASYALGEYYEAAKHYRKAYRKISPRERTKRGKVAFKMGECYARINYTQRAKAVYLNAIRYRYSDSIIFLKVAECYRKTGDYKHAAQNYQIYLEHNPSSRRAKNGLTSCEIAKTWKNNPTRHLVKNAKIFNSRRADYAPVLAGDEFDQLYITSSRKTAKGNEINNITGMKSVDIFLAQKDEKKKWERPEVIDSEINSEFEDGTPAFSPDGKTMYFTRCRLDDQYPAYAEIYASERTGAQWAAPQKCEIIKDSLSSVAHPAVSPDGKYLYFSSDMPGGEGGLDLWRCEILGKDFGYVENLGNKINTPGDEVFPTFRNNGNLYFSSDGHVGMGGLDIYRAQKDSKDKWHIHNMKSPINSYGDDFGMTFEGEYNRGYFASNRRNYRGWDHIYSFEVPEIIYTVTGWVYEKEGYELPKALVNIVGKDGTYKKVNVKKDGSFTLRIKRGTSYAMMATCRGFLNYKQELTTDTIAQNTSYTLQFPLSSIGRPVLIENIFYEYNKAKLTSASTKALNELIQLLKDNPHVTIELSSHCDYVGSTGFNKRLSQRRAESVVQYLIKGGIDKERLRAKGYGKSKPKVVRKRLAEKLKFAKTGDIFTEEYIKKLTPEQQKQCNAINRRTEFTVLRTTYKLYK